MKNEIDYSLFEQFLPKDSKAYMDKGVAYGLVYTRVSSKEQFQKNGSIESQEKMCNRIAEQMQVPILKRFGGSYESAKSEERKEFQSMMEFIRKSKANIKYIFVSDNDRFSRTGANAIYITEQLRKKGIQRNGFHLRRLPGRTARKIRSKTEICQLTACKVAVNRS